MVILARFSKAFFQVEGFGKTIMDHIARVKRQADAFRECAQRCSYVVQVDTWDRVKQLRVDVQRSQQANAIGLTKLGQASYDQNTAIHQQVIFSRQYTSIELRHMEERLRKDLKEGFEQDMKKASEQILMRLQTGLVSMLASSPRVDYRTRERKSDNTYQRQQDMMIILTYPARLTLPPISRAASDSDLQGEHTENGALCSE